MRVKQKSLEQRFWEKVAIAGEDECWLWQSGLGGKGYGSFTVVTPERGRRSMRAHRVAYALAHGPIPDEVRVLHTCDVRTCVNPRHLFLGDDGVNARDREAKGRGNHAMGESHPRSLLDADKVRRIRQLFAAGATQTALAKQYGVSVQTIRNIVYRVTWKHIRDRILRLRKSGERS